MAKTYLREDHFKGGRSATAERHYIHASTHTATQRFVETVLAIRDRLRAGEPFSGEPIERSRPDFDQTDGETDFSSPI